MRVPGARQGAFSLMSALCVPYGFQCGSPAEWPLFAVTSPAFATRDRR
jgi:hypothetical protein